MKLKPGFVSYTVGGENVVVAAGEMADSFHGMIRLNDTGAFLWQQMQTEFTKGSLVTALLDNYEVTEGQAEKAAEDFIQVLCDAGVIEQ